MRRVLFLACALALLCACAAPADTPSADDYELYYATYLSDSSGADAIRSRSVHVENSASMDTAALAQQLVAKLFAAPEGEGLLSPFPGGTSLQRLSVAGGRATVDLSEQYARLSGVDLSIADACLTLTLTQLDGVYAVRITANGRELPYRKTQLLTAADALLSSGEDTVRPINVSLYFLDTATGGLRAQAQTLALYEGQSRLSAVLDALKRGPEGDDTLRVLLPSDFAVLSSRTEDGVCYVNLDGRTLSPKDETLRVRSLARSLLSLDGVDEVQFLVDGEAAPQWTEPAPAQGESAQAQE